MPLTFVQAGRRVRVLTVDSGDGLQGKLASLGLIPGTLLDVVQNSGGPLILRIGEGKIMLGRGMAGKIVVA